jgi:hypothetical protein
MFTGKPYYEKFHHLEDFKRFHAKSYVKKFTKYKGVAECKKKLDTVECPEYIKVRLIKVISFYVDF